MGGAKVRQFCEGRGLMPQFQKSSTRNTKAQAKRSRDTQKERRYIAAMEKERPKYENYIHIRATDDEVRAVERLRELTRLKENRLKPPSAASVVRRLIREALERAEKEANSKPSN